jgi:hypothetical protein
MKLHRVIASSLCLGAAGVAQAQDTGDLVGTWELEYATEACTDVTTTQSWTFSSDGSFRREVDGKSVVGSWSLAEEGRELHLSLDGASEKHVIVALDGRRLELLTPTQVAKGIVLQQERFAAFYHS